MANPIKIEKDGDTYDLHVMWSIHNKCNYQCSYCPSYLNDGSMTWMKLSHFKGFIDKIENHYIKKLGHKNILFSFTGGEPTLWPEFREFLKYINEKGFKVGLTTNASVSVSYWKQISTYFDYICLSFHPEKADIDNFIKTFEFLHNEKNTVIPAVRLMMHPEQQYWDRSIEAMNRLKEFPNWTYECVHILDDYGLTSQKTNYDDDFKTKFVEENSFASQFTENEYVHLPDVGFNYKVEYDDGNIEKLDENKLINENKADFKDWDCFIGIDQLFIEHHGIIKRAGCNVGPHLGSILEYESIIFPDKPIKCTRENCHCPTDIRITKYAKDIPYEINEVNHKKDLVSVNKNNEVIDFRFDIDIDDKFDNEFVSKTEKLINEVLAEKNISPKKTLINFNVVNLSHVEEADLINMFGMLRAFNTRLEIKEIESSQVNYLLECNRLVNKVVVNYYDFEKVKMLVELVKKSQINKPHEINFKFHDSRKIDILSINKIITILTSSTCKIEFLDFDKDNMNKIRGHKNEIFLYPSLGRFILRVVPYTNESLESKRLLYRMDEVSIESEDGQVYSSFNDFVNMESKYKGWKCFNGSNNLVIESDGGIFSSSCGERKNFGNLENFSIQEIINIKPTICSLLECNNKWDQQIKKMRVT